MCSERILSAAARRTRPVAFSEMSVFLVGPEDAPAISCKFPGLRASAVRRPLGPGGSLMRPLGRQSEKGNPQNRCCRDDAGGEKEDAGLPRAEFLNGVRGLRPCQRYLNAPGKGRPLEGRVFRLKNETCTAASHLILCF